MTFCSLAAETCWERWHRNCKKRCKPVYTARHVLPRSNKMRPAKPLATCTVLLFCVSWGRIPFPNQSPLISLIEADAQTTEKYYEEKVPQVTLGLCGSTVPSITSYHYTQPVEKTPWNEHGFIEERASGGHSALAVSSKKKKKRLQKKYFETGEIIFWINHQWGIPTVTEDSMLFSVSTKIHLACGNAEGKHIPDGLERPKYLQRWKFN